MNRSPGNLPSVDLPESTESAASAVTARYLQCGNRRLSLSQARIMGVLNITPDSFSDGGRFVSSGPPDVGRAVAEGCQMMEAGASVLDVGGESSRPGADAVSVEEELRRVMPVVEALLQLDTIVAVDTTKVEVARRALASGCHLINDISGCRDPHMLELLAGSNAGVCMMHMAGEPQTMQNNPQYRDVTAQVREFLENRVRECRAVGIETHRIAIDPGFGFGKSLEHNLTLLRELDEVRVGSLPILVGLSRKSMIGRLTGREVSRRLAGSVAAALLAVQRGADIVRVHDVGATADALKVYQALKSNHEESQAGE